MHVGILGEGCEVIRLSTHETFSLGDHPSDNDPNQQTLDGPEPYGMSNPSQVLTRPRQSSNDR